MASLGSRGREQLGEPLLDDRQPLGQLVGLGGEAGVLGGQLAGRGEVGAGLVQLGGGLVDRGQLGEPPPDLAGRGLVGVDRRVGQPLLQLGVLVEQRGQPVGAHSMSSGPARLAGASTTARRPPVPHGRRAPSATATCGPSCGLTLAYFCWNFATRPAVSSTRCLPV